ncbi:MAG: hypothetical protein ACF8LL_02565 [Phycisphaerales bacterium]
MMNIVVAVYLLMQPVEPGVAVDGFDVIVTGAPYARIIETGGIDGVEVELSSGLMLGDPSFGFAELTHPIVWSVPPGEYEVRYWQDGHSLVIVDVVVVDRASEINAALLDFALAWAAIQDGADEDEISAFGNAWAALLTLAPTTDEIEAALGN